jgi:hypothetical protein
MSLPPLGKPGLKRLAVAARGAIENGVQIQIQYSEAP